MKIKPEGFCFCAGKKFRLQPWPTRTNLFYKSQVDCKTILETHTQELSAFRNCPQNKKPP